MGRSSQTPPDVLDIFESLSSEVVWLHLRWILYCQLYCTNPERIELLNNTAALFFQQLQQVLFQDLVLGLCRLTDPLKSVDKDNLVLQQLCQRLDESRYPTLSANLNQRLNHIKDKCAAFRKHRHRRIAHLDLGAKLNPTKNPLPTISKEMVENALKEIRDFMNEFEVSFKERTTVYEHFIATTDGDALMYALKKAFEYRSLVREGKIPRDHLRKSKYWSA